METQTILLTMVKNGGKNGSTASCIPDNPMKKNEKQSSQWLAMAPTRASEAASRL
jgi:hypothetical protein